MIEAPERKLKNRINLKKEREPHEIPYEEIKLACCKVFEVEIETFDNGKTSKAICIPRYALWLIIRRIKLSTLESIGKPFGRSPQQVRHGIAVMESKIREDSIIQRAFLGIGEVLGAKTIINDIAEVAIHGQ